MSALPDLITIPPRKPPAAEQYNWLTGQFEPSAEQLELPFQLTTPEPPWHPSPEDEGVQLLTTETGSQLFVSGFGLSLGKKSERITIKFNRKLCGQLPFFRVQEIVIAGHGISISSDLIEEACRRGIRIAFLSPNSHPIALLTSPYLTATVLTRRAQLQAETSLLGADLLRWFVAGKLHNQEKLLLYFAKSRTGGPAESLHQAAASLRNLRRQALALPGATPAEARSHALGLEGAGGKLYWTAIAALLRPGLGFRARIHQQPADPVNAALNYGYGILLAHVWGAAMNAGLEPFAGLLHTDRPGKPALALDLIEEFRQPVVDRPLFAWLLKGGSLHLEKGRLDDESREAVASRVIARLNTPEPHRGKSHQIRSIIQMQARLAASAFRGLRPYRPFAFKW